MREKEARLREQLEAERRRNRLPDADEGTTFLATELSAERAARAEAEAKLAQLADAGLAERTSSLARPAKLQSEVVAVFKWLLLEIELVRDSLAVITVEFSDRGPLYRALAELRRTSGRLPPAWKSFQGASGWWERHINDGSNDLGRVYARRASGTDVWRVLVSYKADQPRDAAWLKRN